MVAVAVAVSYLAMAAMAATEDLVQEAEVVVPFALALLVPVALVATEYVS